MSPRLLVLFLAALPLSAQVRIGDARHGGVRTLEEEDYVAGVSAREAEGDWPLESFKVQAVLARSYMEMNRGRHAEDGYDLCDLAHCQVYRGPVPAGSKAHRAAEATRGQVLRRRGTPIHVFYHSACGGRTSAARDVWPGAVSDLPGVSDEEGGLAWCRRAPHFQWAASIDETGLLPLLNPSWISPEKTAAPEVRILRRDPAGRVTALFLSLGGNAYRVRGDDFVMAWGRTRRWHELKSGVFEVEQRGRGFVFRGRGLGHGVGLCQWGAWARATAGHGYREILTHYFPGTKTAR